MNPIERATVLYFHRHRLSLPPHKALGWRTPDSQQIRFAVLSEIGDCSGCSVLDVGCGHGDLKPFLDTRYAGIRYLGIDQQPEFLETARQRYAQQADTAFVQADITHAEFPEVDYVFASGALSYRSSERLYPQAVIAAMWRASRRGLAFNLLDAEVFAADEVLCGQHPQTVLDYCRGLHGSAELRQGYLPDDFTIFMRR